MLGRALCIAIGLSVVALVPRAVAQTAGESPMHARLSWARGAGAETCAPEEQIAQDVIARLGRDPFRDVAPSHRIESVVVRDGETWRASIVVRQIDGTTVGERVIESSAPSCASLDAAAALAVALIIDPESLSRPEPAAALPAPAPAPVEAPAPEVCEPAPAPPAIRPVQGGLSIGAIGSVGSMPGPWVGATIDGFVAVHPLLRIEAGLVYWPEQRAGAFGEIAAIGLTTGRLGLSVPFFAEGIFTLEVGASILAGARHAVVYRLEPLQPGDQPWAAASAIARAGVVLIDPLSLDLAIGALVPFVRTRFAIEGGGPSFQEEPISGWLSLSIGAQFR